MEPFDCVRTSGRGAVHTSVGRVVPSLHPASTLAEAVANGHSGRSAHAAIPCAVRSLAASLLCDCRDPRVVRGDVDGARVGACIIGAAGIRTERRVVRGDIDAASVGACIIGAAGIRTERRVVRGDKGNKLGSPESDSDLATLCGSTRP